MTQYAQFSSIASNSKIDAAAGVIYGVSVITVGEAEGKNAGTFIDQTTLSQIHSVASKFKDGVKVKMSMSKEHDGSVGQIVGVLKNFKTDGNHERADFHLLKSDENFAKIIEMSSTMPTEFGFSVVIPKSIEKVDGKECLRCDDIYSIDLVEAPAANPSGLFSQKPTETTTMTIKYAKGDSGDHATDCECKECMSKQSKKSMTAFLASLLGLPETANDDEIKKTFEAAKAVKTDAALTAKIVELSGKLEAIDATNKATAESAKKAEIANLVAEASRDGKVIPLTEVQLSKMDTADIKEMITKLPKTVQMSRRPAVVPKSADGKVITDRNSPDFRAFLASKREEGALELGNRILAQAGGNN